MFNKMQDNLTKIKNKLTSGAGIFLRNEKGEYLFQLRDDHVYDGGRWGLFGGGLEPGETPEECIKREIKEEIDFDLKEIKKVDEYNNSETVKTYIFLGKIDKPIEELKLLEGQDFGFFSTSKMLNMPLTKNVMLYIDKIDGFDI
jgi:8-oxo-dGTP pyrophosphatase MutT (NUDIX family)